MEIAWDERGDSDFQALEKTLQRFFKAHLEKLSKMPPRRHLKHGLPFFVEDVTKQARLVYLEDGELLRVIRCFATHKEYEKWYNSFR